MKKKTLPNLLKRKNQLSLVFGGDKWTPSCLVHHADLLPHPSFFTKRNIKPCISLDKYGDVLGYHFGFSQVKFAMAAVFQEPRENNRSFLFMTALPGGYRERSHMKPHASLCRRRRWRLQEGAHLQVNSNPVRLQINQMRVTGERKKSECKHEMKI